MKLITFLTLGLFGREKSRKKMPDGHGVVEIYLKLSASRKGVRKDLKKFLPYVTEVELDAIFNCYNNWKQRGSAYVRVFVDEPRYEMDHAFNHIIVLRGTSLDCGECALTDCCNMPQLGSDPDDLHLKDYYILEYLGKKDWEHGYVDREDY